MDLSWPASGLNLGIMPFSINQAVDWQRRAALSAAFLAISTQPVQWTIPAAPQAECKVVCDCARMDDAGVHIPVLKMDAGAQLRFAIHTTLIGY